mmetsp:Transcript_11147/g.26268  ORF Transcript_11147/g.26268 Transcript_11147/m.26268 type:complete len:259 (-) Transcript_11147:141-917(-)
MCKSIEHTTSLSSSSDQNNHEQVKDAAVTPVRQEKARSVSPSPPCRAGCRTVTFSQTEEKEDLVDFCLIPTLSEMTEKEIRASWYNEGDSRKMRKSALITLKRMITNTLKDDFEAEDTTRGLENKTPMGSTIRKENRYNSLWTVLLEQSRQRRLEQPVDCEKIAYLYKKSNAHCQLEAIEIAANDAKVVQEERGKIAHLFVTSQTVAAIAEPVVSATGKPARRMSASFVSPIVQRPQLACVMSPQKTRSRRRLLAMMN